MCIIHVLYVKLLTKQHDITGLWTHLSFKKNEKKKSEMQ